MTGNSQFKAWLSSCKVRALIRMLANRGRSRLGITTTGESRRPPGVVKFLQVSNEGANELRLYFTEADYDADENYVSLAATTGYFDGPVELGGSIPGPNGRDQLWLRSVTGDTTAVVVWYLRRA